jgi:hypothetical protein
MRSELNPQPLPPGFAAPGQSIRVTAPASVLNDLETFQRAQAGVLKRAGCPGCTSGLHLLWQVFTDYTVSESGEVRSVEPGSLGAD